MLQFNATLAATVRMTPRLYWRFTALFTSSPSAIASESVTMTAKDKDKSSKSSQPETPEAPVVKTNMTNNKEQSGKFDELKKIIQNSINSESLLSNKVESAQSLNDLLDLMMLPGISQNNMLKIMSTITNWVNNSKADLTDIQGDKRFINLQKLMGKTDKQKYINKNSEFNEFSKLSTPAMIEVISDLAERRNRHTPLIRYLSRNITEYNEALNAGQCSKLLYSLSVLNFIDENLLEKICSNLTNDCAITKASLLTSITTSLGILKYKNEELLDAFCDVILDSKVHLKPKQFVAVLQTLATLGFNTEKVNLFIQRFILPVKEGLLDAEGWLDLVWCLVVLDKAENSHLASVLNKKFITKINDLENNVAKKLKLLNINAAAQYTLKDYDGPLIKSDSSLLHTVSNRKKQKQLYVDALSSTLQMMLPSSSHFEVNVNTEMGFFLDGMCCMDSKSNPVTIANANTSFTDVTRIAIMLNDYNDYCRGKKEILGTVQLYSRLLKAKGYYVLNVSYEYFGLEDKLVKRVKYLKECIKLIREQSST